MSLGVACVAAVLAVGCSTPAQLSENQAKPPAADRAAAFQLQAENDVGSDLINRVAAAAGEPFGYDLPAITGSGCGIGDLDGDGRLDLVLVSLSSQDDASRGELIVLWQNPSGGFHEAATTRLPLPGIGMGITIGDLTNDGLPELLATCVGHDALFHNEGTRSFREVAAEAGYRNPAWGTAAALVDLNRDGWLDIVVTTYVDYSARPCRSTGGGPPDFCSPHLFEGSIDRVFFNTTPETADGTLQLEDRTALAGLATMRGAGLGLVAADLTGDGLVDLYVANDQMTNSLWVNQGDGHFVDEAILRGCGYDRQGRAQASMGVALSDLDADGHYDLFLTHLSGEYHTLYRGLPEGVFEDATVAVNLAAATQSSTGFGVAACDLDLDGDDDLVVANGHVRRPDGTPPGPSDDPFAPYRQPLQFFRNEDGRFREAACGERALCEPMLARGLAVGDLDNDGDLDLLINRTGSPPLLIRNEASGADTHWLRVRTELPDAGGRHAIGADITVSAGSRRIRRLVQPSLGYLSSSDPRVHVGLGEAAAYDAIEVVWPDGSRSTHPGGPANREVVLRPSGSAEEATP